MTSIKNAPLAFAFLCGGVILVTSAFALAQEVEQPQEAAPPTDEAPVNTPAVDAEFVPDRYSGEAFVDLQKLDEQFVAFCESGQTDLEAFEAIVNDKTNLIYLPMEHVEVVQSSNGAIVGYIDTEADGKWDANDTFLFAIGADGAQKQIVTHDWERNYYVSSNDALWSAALITTMLAAHKTAFKGGNYVIHRDSILRDAAYYQTVRDSRSMRSNKRQGSGGFGFGK